MTSRDPERWRRIRQIFDNAIDRVGADRAKYLADSCGDDEVLLSEVEQMLAADASVGDFLERPASEVAGDLAAEADIARDMSGTRIGPWKLVGEIGRGGMGAVYRAERADGQFAQTVAIKLLKRGMDSEEILTRFLRERQILARFEHPNIARLLDGGLHEDVPYFVMEFVDGSQLTDHCDNSGCSLRERLELFLPICRGVAYAHRNLVVHRDLKPSNIMVNAGGEVKLLDFGVAKILGGDEDGNDIDSTLTGHLVMTPRYAAPEQLRGQAVTTGTDIYALGVLLYELLSGQHPLTDGLETPYALLNREYHDPVPPGTLRSELRGDLENIILKAMSAQPEDRFRSADALAEDIERHLTGQPIQARPPSLRYRLGKFVRRNRVPVAAAIAAVLALSIGLVSTMYQVRQTQRKSAEISAVKNFLVSMLEIADPSVSKGGELTARQMLDFSADKADKQLRSQPVALAEVLEVMGWTYSRIGAEDPAIRMLRRAVEVRLEHRSPDDPDLQRLYKRLGEVHMVRLELAPADSCFSEALRLARHNLDPGHSWIASPLTDMAVLRETQGDLEGAGDFYEQALQLRPDPKSLVRLATLNNLASLRERQGRYADAEDLYRQSIAGLAKRYGEDDPNLLKSKNNLMILMRRRQDFAGAEALAREVEAKRREVLGDHHPDLAITLFSLGSVVRDQGRLDEAEPILTEALDILIEARGTDNPIVATLRVGMVKLRREQGRLDEAEEMASTSHATVVASLPPTHPYVGIVKLGLARVLLQQKKPAAAEPLIREALAIRAGSSGADSPAAADCRIELGACLVALGNLDEARTEVQRALPVLREALGPERAGTLRAEAILAEISPADK